MWAGTRIRFGRKCAGRAGLCGWTPRQSRCGRTYCPSGWSWPTRRLLFFITGILWRMEFAVILPATFSRPEKTHQIIDVLIVQRISVARHIGASVSNLLGDGFIIRLLAVPLHESESLPASCDQVYGHLGASCLRIRLCILTYTLLNTCPRSTRRLSNF